MEATSRGRLLLVEDDLPLARMMLMQLQTHGYAAAHVSDGTAALRAVADDRPDLVLLDIGLPGELDGMAVCRRLRAAGDWTPIIFLTARDDDVDKILSLELGGDDYITKPFSPREVVARVSGLLRRVRLTAQAAEAAEPRPADQPLVLDDLRVRVAERRAFVGDRELDLTVKEFDLLATLMARPNRVLTRIQLLELVWGAGHAAGERTVDVHVAQLRAKLGEAGDVVRTVRGVGYGTTRSRP